MFVAMVTVVNEEIDLSTIERPRDKGKRVTDHHLVTTAKMSRHEPTDVGSDVEGEKLPFDTILDIALEGAQQQGRPKPIMDPGLDHEFRLGKPD